MERRSGGVVAFGVRWAENSVWQTDPTECEELARQVAWAEAVAGAVDDSSYHDGAGGRVHEEDHAVRMVVELATFASGTALLRHPGVGHRHLLQ